MNLINVEAFWVSLLGFWLSYSLATFGICCTRLHWFLKFLAIAGMAGVLLFIEAPDLMLMVLAQCVTIFLMLAAGKAWADRKAIRNQSNVERTTAGLPQIGLLNAMLGVAAMCILLTAVQVDLLEAPMFGASDHVPLVYCLSFGVSLGLVSALALWLANLKLRWVLAINIIACAAGAIAIPRIIFRPEGVTAGLAFLWGELPDFAISILIANSIAIFLLGVTRRFIWSNKIWIKRVAQTGNVLMVATVFLLATATVQLYVCLLGGPRVDWPLQQSDQVNGFDELVTIGKRIWASELLNHSEAPSAGPELKRELQKFSSDFDHAERALQRPILTSALSNIDEYESMVDKTSEVRVIARALQCRAIQHLHEGDPDAALADACLMSELSVPLRRGRTIVTELVANAIEGMSHFQAMGSFRDASSESLELAMSRLAALEPAEQHFSDLYENDAAITWAYNFWQDRLNELVFEEEFKESFESYTMNHFRRCSAIRRQAITLMAIELFRRQEKRYPADLESLVPTFLDSVPLDPFLKTAAGNPLVYRLSEDGSSFELYSVGPDQVDDNGKLDQFGCSWDKGDLNLTATIKYEDATTDAERQELTIPDP